MTETTAPLHESETGTFGQLSQRPNPKGLVILQVPAFEDMLPFLEQRAGRKLTPEEIEEHRQRHPAIVVPREVAAKMQATRAARK